MTNERYDKMKNHNGDAMHEVIGDKYSYFGVITIASEHDWKVQLTGGSEHGTGYYNGDFALIGNSNLCFEGRGGSWSNDNGGGIFALDGGSANPDRDDGFRPILVV